jgi:hypothetical protein
MSLRNTKIYQKTQIVDETSATSGDGALIVNGGVYIDEALQIGSGLDGLVFAKNDTNTINRTGTIQLAANGGFGVFIQGSDTSSISTTSGNITVNSDVGAIALNAATNVTVNGTIAISTGSGNNISSTGDLTIDADTNSHLYLNTLGTGRVRINQNPVNDYDVVPKVYVDSLAAGLDVHASCRVIAVTLPAYTAAGSQATKTLTADAPGILTVDGVSLVLNDRVLVNLNSVADIDNGIYYVTTEGTVGDAFVLTRAPDANSNPELTTGSFTFIEEGTVYAGSGFVLTTPAPITVDTTPLLFVQFSSAGVLVISQIGSGLPIFDNNGNNKDFYSFSALVDNDHGAATDALTIEYDGAGTNTYVLDMSKFQGQVTFSNQVSGPIEINPFNNILLIKSKFRFNTSTGTFSTDSGNLTIAPATNNLIVGTVSTVAINTSNASESLITGSADLSLVSTAGTIKVLPSDFITTFGTGNTFAINTSAGTITRGNGAMTLTNTISGGITLLPFNGISTFGNTNSLTVNTTSDPVINGSSTTTFSTSAGDIIIAPASNVTSFGTTTPVQIDDSLGQITRAGVLDINTTSGNLTLTPSTGVTSAILAGSVLSLDVSGTPTIRGNTSLTVDTDGGNLILTPSTNITQFGSGVSFTVNDSTGTISRANTVTLSTTAGGVNISPANDVTTIGTTTTATFNNSTSPTLTGSTTMTIASTSGNVISNASTGITQFGTSTPVLINSNGTISRADDLTISTVTTGDITIAPVTGITNFNSTLTIDSLGPDPDITANSGNLSIVGSAGTITLSTNSTNYTAVTSGSSTLATASTGSGTLRVFGPSPATGGLAVDGTAFVTTSVNAPTFSNGAAGTGVSLRANTTDATGVVRIPTTKVLYGNNSVNNRYVGTFTKSENYTGGPATVPLFTFVLPNNLNVLLRIDVVVDDGANVYIHAAKVLVRTDGSGVVTKVDLFEEITDPKFTYSLAIANTAILNYTQTNANSIANMTVTYYTCGTANVDITSFT